MVDSGSGWTSRRAKRRERCAMELEDKPEEILAGRARLNQERAIMKREDYRAWLARSLFAAWLPMFSSNAMNYQLGHTHQSFDEFFEILSKALHQGCTHGI